MVNTFSLISIAVMAGSAVAQSLTPGGPCPPGGGNFCVTSFSNIILRCTTPDGVNGILQPGNCDDNLAGLPPVGVKTDAICGNSTANNADCFIPPYPPFITVPSTTTTVVSQPMSAPSAPASMKPANSTTKPANATVVKPTTLPTFVSGAGHNVVIGSAFAVVMGGVLAFVL